MIRTDNTYTTRTEQGQNLFDIAIQEYGSVEQVFKLMADNSTAIPNLNAALTPGTALEIEKQPTGIKDLDLMNLFRDNKVVINTGDDVEPSNYLLQEDLDLILQEDEDGILI